MPKTQAGEGALLGVRGVLVGCGEMPPPPGDGGGFRTLFVVLIPGQWVVCVSGGLGKYNWDESRKALGRPMDGEVFAPFAQRGLPTTMPFEAVRKTIEDSFPDATMEWLRDDKPKVVIP